MALQQENAQGKTSDGQPKSERAAAAPGLKAALTAVVWLFCALATVLPVANIGAVLATNGADNLCNDYLQYAGLIDRMLSGNYNWLTYVSDTFYRTHSVAIPVLFHLADARLFHWSIYPELAAGVVLAAIRLAFLYVVLSSSISGWRKWALCPALAFLIFSNSQMSVFCYGDGALTIGLSLLGFAIGLWGLTRVRGEAAASLCILAGGLIASFSWGNGLVTWMVFLAGLVLTGRRKPGPYIAWGAGLALSLFPYVQALLIARLNHSVPERAGTSIVSFFNWHFFVNALGWPFANDIAFHTEGLRQAKVCGWLALALAAVCLIILFKLKRPELWKASAPALLCMLHGAVSIWQISVFRTLIAPWYTAVSISFWIGLLGISPVLYQYVCRKGGEQATASASLRKVTYVWCVCVPLLIAIAYLCSNLTYDDKTNLLFSRSPASASALRHFRDGPTYGESFVFQWGAGNPGLIDLLAAPLEKNHLSVFAPHQVWTLQGDYLLDTVRLLAGNKDLQALWTTSQSDKDRLPWSHYKHLNLLLPSPDAVSWTVSIPKDCQQADFRSAVAVGSISGYDPGSEPVLFELHIKPERLPERSAFNLMMRAGNRAWHDFNFSLAEYRGQTITLRLSSKALSGRPGIPAVFRYPYIDLQSNSGTATDASKAPIESPSNTELSPLFTKRTNDDFVVSTGAPALSLPSARALSINLSDYGHFMLSVKAATTLTPRAVNVSLYPDHSSAAMSFTIPLLADGSMYSYTYDLKLLEQPLRCQLTGLKITFSNPAQISKSDLPVLSEVRFVK